MNSFRFKHFFACLVLCSTTHFDNYSHTFGSCLKIITIGQGNMKIKKDSRMNPPQTINNVYINLLQNTHNYRPAHY